MESFKNFLKEYSDYIDINCNDVFAYGSGSSVQINIYDIPKLREIEYKYGWDGVLAFCAAIEGEAPLKHMLSSKYYEAKKELDEYVFFEDLSCVDDIKLYMKIFDQMSY
jgi:hypothetical protein